MNELLNVHAAEDEISRTQTPVLVVGLPGKMATLVAEALSRDQGFHLLPYAITSARQRQPYQEVAGQRISLLNYCPIDQVPGTIVVDYTTPESSNVNVINYTQLGIPFVMGTTGGNRQEMERIVRNSKISAVIAPNMAASVVEVQAKLDRLLETSPNHFQGWHMIIRESHQATKRDVSGTARAFQAQLEKLGAVMDNEIESIRDPEVQRQLGIQNLEGHGYHWIKLIGPNGETKEIATKIEGRGDYVELTLDSVSFLKRRTQEGSRGEIYTVNDVIRDRRAVA